MNDYKLLGAILRRLTRYVSESLLHSRIPYSTFRKYYYRTIERGEGLNRNKQFRIERKTLVPVTSRGFIKDAI